VVRVGDTYVLATSTFEWWPGVRLHTSRDLLSWEPAGHAFTDPAHLDLRDVPDSGGLWAPSLSHDGERFWLVVGLVHTWTGPFKDVDVLLTTAERIDGPWTAPVRLGGGGFDPSVFHDDDGRHWLVNMRWDHRPAEFSFAGITLQEIDFDGVVGEERRVLTSDELLEGPNLYRHDGWYHLMLAEGGTGWNHGIRTARSRAIEGPYDVDPEPLLTTRDNPQWPLQKAGHGELVAAPDGGWAIVHLASRPQLSARGPVCVLGRETCVQRIVWDQGRLRLADGGHWPAGGTPLRRRTPYPVTFHDDFDQPRLHPRWVTLREPPETSWVDLDSRPGRLRLRGRRSLFASTGVSLLATRLLTTQCTVTTELTAEPSSPAQRAGLVVWYDRLGHHLLAVTGGPDGPELVVSTSDCGDYREVTTGIGVGDWPSVRLRARIDGLRLEYDASPDGRHWSPAGPPLDLAVVSDDRGDRLRFTGAMVGVAAEDTGPGTLVAEFSSFAVRDDRPDEGVRG
jgi:xylan 1,4-beta-xylosidase